MSRISSTKATPNLPQINLPFIMVLFFLFDLFIWESTVGEGQMPFIMVLSLYSVHICYYSNFYKM